MSDFIQRISLSEFFKFKAPTHLLGTTYTVSLMFFESALWPIIDKSALRRCALLCDKKGFRRSVCEAVGLEQASISYMAIPVPTNRTFHPKFWIAANENQVSILIGSGNLTQSGFMDNNELFDVLTFEGPSDERMLVEDLRAFLIGLGELFTASDENGRWIKETLGQIRELLPKSLKNDNTPWSIRLLHSFAGSFPEQLANLFPIEGGRLYIASPYFGSSLEGLDALRGKLHPEATVVCPAVGSDGTVNLRGDLLKGDASVEVAQLNIGDTSRLSHFKLYGMTDALGNGWLFNGSVNCTNAAMSAENIEAGLVRLVKATTVKGYFSNRVTIHDLRYKPLPQPLAEELWLNIYAHKTGTGVEIHLNDAEAIALPLLQLKITVRMGNAIEETNYAAAFHSPSNRLALPWDAVPGIAGGDGAVFIELKGLDSAGHFIHGANFSNDLEALSSTPAYRNAFGAALKLSTSDAIPGIFDISAISSFLEEVALGGTGEGTEKHSATSGTGLGKSEDEPVVPIWPPRAYHRCAVEHFSSGETCITWLQRILALILNSEGDEGFDSDPEKIISGIEPRPGGAAIQQSETTRIWERMERLFLRLKDAINNGNLPPKVFPRLIPSLVIASWMLLGTRRKMIASGLEKQGRVTSFGHLNNLLMLVLGCIFGPRGEVCCLADDLREAGIELPKDFVRIFLLFFAYLYALEQRNYARKFPLPLWLKFQDHASPHLQDLAQDTNTMKRTFDTFLTSVELLEWDTIHQGAMTLLREDWQSIEGLQVYRFLKSYTPNHVGREPDLVVKAMGDEGISGIRLLVKRGLPLKFHPAKSTERFCTSAKCGRVEDPRFAKLQLLLPVICLRCRTISVPNSLMELERRNGE